MAENNEKIPSINGPIKLTKPKSTISFKKLSSKEKLNKIANKISLNSVEIFVKN